jgi:hypothetical protein
VRSTWVYVAVRYKHPTQPSKPPQSLLSEYYFSRSVSTTFFFFFLSFLIRPFHHVARGARWVRVPAAGAQLRNALPSVGINPSGRVGIDLEKQKKRTSRSNPRNRSEKRNQRKKKKRTRSTPRKEEEEGELTHTMYAARGKHAHSRAPSFREWARVVASSFV